MKRFFRRLYLKTLSFGIYLFFRLYALTLRCKEIQSISFDKDLFIAALWHRDLFMAIALYRKQKFTTMASRSKDGDLISYTLENLNFKVARGSSGQGKNGGNALMQMCEYMLKDHVHAALTVDGPRGPASKVKRGIIELSSKTQVPIRSLSCLPKRYIEFKSWDKFRLPLPFTQIHVYWGNQMMVPKNLSHEQALTYMKELETHIEGAELKLHQSFLR